MRSDRPHPPARYDDDELLAGGWSAVNDHQRRGRRLTLFLVAVVVSGPADLSDCVSSTLLYDMNHGTVVVYRAWRPHKQNAYIRQSQ